MFHIQMVGQPRRFIAGMDFLDPAIAGKDRTAPIAAFAGFEPIRALELSRFRVVLSRHAVGRSWPFVQVAHKEFAAESARTLPNCFVRVPNRTIDRYR